MIGAAMSRANLAHINPDIITWALAKRGLTIAEVATKQLTADQIKAWQERRALPTHPQAEALAEKLRIPFLVLFLSEKPSIELEIPDLRTMSGQAEVPPSTEFLQVINDTLLKQDWYRELRQEQRIGDLPFVGKFAMRPDVAAVANDISKSLSLRALREAAHSWKEFLDLFISNTESVGIMVFRSSLVGHATKRKLTVKEFRGFVLNDPLAPAIFINDEDAKAAQTFTLAHELAHIWVGATGITDPNLKKRSGDLANPIEQLCNRVAAEVLVPREDFDRAWDRNRDLPYNLNALGTRYRVSSLVILIRAHELGKISDSFFDARFDSEMKRFREQDKKDKAKELETKKKQKGNFWASFTIRNSKTFSDAVVTAVKEHHTGYTEGASLLGVRAATFERYLDRLEKQP